MVPWDAITSIATAISMIAFVVTALLVRGQLKALEKERFLAISNQLFAIWETKEFMDAQLWLLHRLKERTWDDFVKVHRADVGEEAFHRVGSFYNRIGTLVRQGMVNREQILTTIGGYAIAVWQKIEPLVQEARRLENSTLFEDFERVLPACHECFVPLVNGQGEAKPFVVSRGEDERVERLSVTALRDRIERGDAVTPVDSRQTPQVASEPQIIPGAVLLPPDEIETRHSSLPRDRELIVYCA